MSYLGHYERPSTWEIACNGCDRKVRGKEPPKTWLTDTDPIPMKHYCPRCRARREKDHHGSHTKANR